MHHNMMDIIKSTGESSSREREDGDGVTSSERPLKKARFAWQVKGKYHLKNETDQSNKNLTRPAEPSTSKPSSKSQGSSGILANNVENHLIKQDYSKLTDNSLLTAIELTTEQLQYPRYISQSERTPKNVFSANYCNNMITMSMPNNAEDQCIAQWQAKQLGIGCLDNSLNRLLELWATDPLPTQQADSHSLALEFAEFINHLPGDNSVENEGILMAISAHGLQNTPSSNSNNTSAENHSVLSAFDIPSPSRCMSPVISDDSQGTNVGHCETENKSELLDWQIDNQNTNDNTPFAYYSDPSQSPYHFYHDTHLNSNPDSLDVDNHFDFMNAAVLYAIKSKGLTASGTEYG